MRNFSVPSRACRRTGQALAAGRFRAREAVVIEDVETDPDYAPFIEVARHAGYRSVVSVPLISARNALVGVLPVHSSARQRPLSSEILFLSKFAEVTANAVNGYFSR